MEKRYGRLGETVERITLGNGLTIYAVPKPEYSKSYALFATHYGGIDLRFRLGDGWMDTPAGVAHFLEHKMFDTKDGNALQELAKGGASPNAFTGSDMTAYYFDSTEQFEKNLRIMLDFVSVPYFTPESVQKEQGIIGQEIRMIEDDPNWCVYTNLSRALYENHPIRATVAGTVESIAGITAQTLYDCHRAFYNPSNMVLCVMGNFEPDKIFRLAEEVLPREGLGEIQRDYGKEEPSGAFQERIETRMEVSTPIFLLGYKDSPRPEGKEGLRRTLTARLACDLLFGDSSPLYADLYSKGLINRNFGGDYEAIAGGAFVVAGGESKNPDAVREALLREAQRIGREGFDRERFERTRKAAFGNRLRALNSFDGTCVQLAEFHFLKADYFDFPEIFDTITAKDAQAYLAETIRPEKTAISIVKPKESEHQ